MGISLKFCKYTQKCGTDVAKNQVEVVIFVEIFSNPGKYGIVALPFVSVDCGSLPVSVSNRI